ncbi:ATP-binding protein [Streptomyces sp. NPDC058644]|uniref:ATP-binding protein n=1 Tax=unclassified Streptomyces TaxID=2593676 RepID=UPI003651D4C2
MSAYALITLHDSARVEIAPSPADRTPQEIATPVQSTAPDWGLALGISAAGFAARSFGTDPVALSQIRQFTRDVLSEWGLANFAGDAVVVASELAANAMRHALDRTGNETNSSAWLGLVRSERALICVVADPSPAPPVPQQESTLAEHGRGLSLVHALTSRWGYSEPDGQGKTIWARIPIPPR